MKECEKVGHVARVEVMKNLYTIIVKKPNETVQGGRPRYK